jgi:hypothetical protein
VTSTNSVEQLEARVSFVEERMPDLVGAFDALQPKLLLGEPDVFRRWALYYREAAREVSIFISHATFDTEQLQRWSALRNEWAHRGPSTQRAFNLERMLILRAAELIYAAPSRDGHGMIAALVDAATSMDRGSAPLFHFQLPPDDEFARVIAPIQSMLEEADERFVLQEVMRLFALRPVELGEIMDVRRQAVDQWLAGSVPVERQVRLVTMMRIGRLLAFRLIEGAVPSVARTPAAKYDDKTYLDLFAEGRETEVLDELRRVFDYAGTSV